jgi:hypothetical protein
MDASGESARSHTRWPDARVQLGAATPSALLCFELRNMTDLSAAARSNLGKPGSGYTFERLGSVRQSAVVAPGFEILRRALPLPDDKLPANALQAGRRLCPRLQVAIRLADLQAGGPGTRTCVAALVELAPSALYTKASPASVTKPHIWQHEPDAPHKRSTEGGSLSGEGAAAEPPPLPPRCGADSRSAIGTLAFAYEVVVDCQKDADTATAPARIKPSTKSGELAATRQSSEAVTRIPARHGDANEVPEASKTPDASNKALEASNQATEASAMLERNSQSYSGTRTLVSQNSLGPGNFTSTGIVSVVSAVPAPCDPRRACRRACGHTRPPRAPHPPRAIAEILCAPLCDVSAFQKLLGACPAG